MMQQQLALSCLLQAPTVSVHCTGLTQKNGFLPKVTLPYILLDSADKLLEDLVDLQAITHHAVNVTLQHIVR